MAAPPWEKPVVESPGLAPRQRALLNQIRVNLPLTMLLDGFLDRILDQHIHPELGLDAPALDRFSPADLKEPAGLISGAGLRPSVHGPYIDLGPGAVDPLILEVTRRRFGQALELAALFQPEYCVFHAYYDESHHIYYREEWLETSLATWRSLARRARELGLRVLLENVYESGPQDLAPLLGPLAAEGVGFCFDTGHAFVHGRTSLEAWIEELAPYLAALHLHDNRGRRDEHLPLGQGGIDFAALFSRLVQKDLRPAVTLEPHREKHLWTSLAALEKLWPWPLDE